MKRLGKLCGVIIVALVVGGVSSQARANTTYCSVTDVGTSGAYAGGNQETTPSLTIVCGGVSYYVNQSFPAPGGSCSPSYGPEIVKTFVSLATSAFTMARHLNINYVPASSSCSTPTIASVDLVN